MRWHPDVGLILAGGRAARLGGVDKPALLIAGAALIERTLTALGDVPTVVVGPARELSRPVLLALESPAGGGPAAAVCAGLSQLDGFAAVSMVAILAADLPAITAATLSRLANALHARPDADGAVLVDADQREQWLISVWHLAALRRAIAGRQDWTGGSVRAFFAPLTCIRVPARDGEDADIDDPATLARWQAGTGGP